VGLYARRILPRLLDLAMRNPWATVERERLIPRAAGVVLELGAGSGLNLRHYVAPAGRVIAVDPSPGLHRLAARRMSAARVPVDYVLGVGEALPLASASVDTAVVTWTLCSVTDPARALTEVRRVLKTDGRLLFVEHGRAPDPSVRRWQEWLTPHWRRLAGGCHLDRPIDLLIRDAGFSLPELDRRYIGHPRSMTYFYRGVAAPDGAPPARSQT
jgi:ubiquinone/menaquinone biosynthesis C-methylase UbiE